ncbi:MAG: GPW/gp25 family protein [Aristaeellaceae bacterium]
MRRTIDTANPPTLTLFPKTAEEEIIQSVYCILATIKGSVPCYREYGLSSNWIHRPVNAVESAYAVAVSQALSEYEPRVRVESIIFVRDHLHPDHLHPILEVNILESSSL